MYRPKIVRWVDAVTGQRVKAGTPGAVKTVERSKTWVHKIGGVPVPLGRNKVAAQAKLAELLKRHERVKAGVHDPVEDHHCEPLLEQLAEFEADLKACRTRRKRPPTRKAVDLVLTQVRRALRACKFVFARDVNLAAVQRFLDALQAREEPCLPRRDLFSQAEAAKVLGVKGDTVARLVRRWGLAVVRQSGVRGPRYPLATIEELQRRQRGAVSETTRASYAANLKRFTRWLVKRSRLRTDPLADLVVARPESSHTHDRRPLSEVEVVRFLDTTLHSQHSFRGLSGQQRHALYVVALATGFRAGELAALTPALFDLESAPPTVTLPEAPDKSRRGAVQPLPLHVVAIVGAYLDGKPAALPLWPGTWRCCPGEMLQRDLEAAGIAYTLPGPNGPLFADFHALRHSFCAALKRSGATLLQAMDLMRHTEPRLTARVYGREGLPQLADVVNRVAPLVAHDTATNG